MVLAKRSHLRELNIPRASSKSDNLCVCPDIDSVVPIIASNSKPSSPEKKINKSGNNRKDYRTNVFVVVSHVWKFTGVVIRLISSFQNEAGCEPDQQTWQILAYKTLVARQLPTSGLRYLECGDIPVLSLMFSGRGEHKLLTLSHLSRACDCPCTTKSGNRTKNEEEPRKIVPYAAPGPSKVQELVPLKTLKKEVSLSQQEGLQYLDHTSLSHYYQCKLTTDPIVSKHSKKQCHKRRRFMNRKEPITALVSFHGSENTWVRYLIEQATGVFTGSIYCDSVLKVTFPGESVASGNVVVVKTHHADTRELPKDVQLETGKSNYDRAVVLVRNPFDALVSEANRRWNSDRLVNSHVGLAEEAAFVGNSKWDWLVEYKGATWSFLLHTWLSQTEIPVHVVQYEELVRNTREELVKILDFLEVKVSEDEIDCAVENSEGPFKRTSHLNFDPFSKANKETVNRCISQATPLLAVHGIKYDKR